ncbi:hypothetical protein ACLMJK_006355 [Lecanora helva]
MLTQSLSLLSLLAFATAQSSSTVSLFLPFADPQSLVASIAGADSTATTYVLACANATTASPVSATSAAVSASATGFDDDDYDDDDTDDDDDDSENDCGIPDALTVVQGASTVHYVLSIPNAGAETVNCALTGTTAAICTGQASGSALTAAGSHALPPLTTETLAPSDVSFLPVVITAGSAMAKQTGGSSVSAKATGSTGSTWASQTGSSASGGATGSARPSAQGSSAGVVGKGVRGGTWGAVGVAVAGVLV